MFWHTPKIWKNQDVWIVGGGPSLTSTFNIPEEIVSKVRENKLPLSSYSPFMEVLHDKRVIGINVAYQLGDWVDMVFYGDGNFLKKYEKRLFDFNGLCVTCSPHGAPIPWMKYLERARSQRFALSPNSNKVVWNQTSGAAAINLAVHLGAKRIILIAFDMNLTANRQHWHGVYRSSLIEEKEKIKKKKVFERHLRPFPDIKRNLDKLGIKIYNISPNSAIKCIETRTLEQVL
jgi:hypothetical protein